MLPTPRLFRSRWKAAIWAGGILWMAVDVANSAPSGHHGVDDASTSAAATDATGDAVDPADLAALANIMSQ